MYKIVIDSCGELPEDLKKDGHYQNVSLELEVDGCYIRDDETFDQKDFLRRVKESVTGPKSACPSPDEYMKSYEGDADHVYVVTLSGKLSGSYNSAELGKNLFEEEHPGEKKIYVFNSRSASVGETLIGMKVQECEEAGMSFEEVVAATEKYISSMNTFFVLETLETLRKNGRLTNLKAFIANTLNIKPVMGSTEEGSICQLGQARGMNKALDKMIQDVIAKIDPMPGAKAFLDALRAETQTVILSDTFEQFGLPLMEKLNWPTLLCNTLEVGEDGMISGFRMRCSHSKLTTVRAFQSMGYDTIASGDSYNDLEMILASKAGFLFRSTDKIKADYPQLPAFETYDELLNGIKAAMA